MRLCTDIPTAPALALRIARGLAVGLMLVLAPGLGPATAPTPALAQDAHGHEDEHGDTRTHEDLVRLSYEELEEFDIELATAGPGTVVHTVEVPGEVRPNADRLAHIVPRYAGIVTEVDVAIGDRVRKGQRLAVVEGDESLAPFDVVTLLSGTVVEKHITLGEAVGRESPAFVIADLSTVWIELTVYQRDLDRVRAGQRAFVLVGHEVEATGTIDYVTPVVSERTRTATARVVLPNEGGRWRPGMFVTGRIVVERAEVPLAVERTALHDFEGDTVVFVRTEEGFVPRPVEVGRTDDAHAEILGGLAPGQRYVSRGGFTLKSELGKSGFGSGHAH